MRARLVCKVLGHSLQWHPRTGGRALRMCRRCGLIQPAYRGGNA